MTTQSNPSPDARAAVTKAISDLDYVLLSISNTTGAALETVPLLAKRTREELLPLLLAATPLPQASPGLKEGVPTAEEAQEIALRYINAAFGNKAERPRHSIPADPLRDDDIRLLAFIRSRLTPTAHDGGLGAGPTDTHEISFTGQGYNIPEGGHINLLGGCASLSHGIVERISSHFPGQKGFSAVITLSPLAAMASPTPAQGKEGSK